MNKGDFLFRGIWREDEIEIVWRPELLRDTTPQIEAEIARRWEVLLSTKRYVFDGRLCRLIGYSAGAGGVVMTAGPTSYREYHGTNPRADIEDSQRANPLAVCCGVHTSDSKVVVLRRSAGLPESAQRWHVIGGHVEADTHVKDNRVLPFRRCATS